MIELPGEGPIGTVGLDPDGVLSTEVGYWLGRPLLGPRLCDRSAHGGLAWARDGWGRRCVTAATSPTTRLRARC